MNERVEIYTDGACSGNPGPGGWAALLRYQGKEKTLAGFAPATTNNRMELVAVIEALSALKRPVSALVYTDSQYVQKGVNEWLPNWKRRGWKTAEGKPIKNLDLWQRLDALTKTHRIEWHWLRGHAGHADNERVDALAKEALRKGMRT